MRREEALRNIGKPVYLWTGLHGEYYGILREVTEHKPWRGIVEILAVLEYPTQGLSPRGLGFRERKPFRKGQLISGGAISIRLLTENEKIPDYDESLRRALKKKIKQCEDCLSFKDDWLMRKQLDVLKKHLDIITKEEIKTDKEGKIVKSR